MILRVELRSPETLAYIDEYPRTAYHDSHRLVDVRAQPKQKEATVYGNL